MDSISKKVFGSMNYDTYINMQNTIFFGGVGMHFINHLTIQEPAIATGITIAYLFNVYTLLGFKSRYTKDVTQINELYNEYIKNYNKLNKMFDFNDPVEIYAMYNYLLYKGYLSVNKEFKYGDEIARDIVFISGANTITGRGVCRHISATLTDILNDLEITASNVAVDDTFGNGNLIAKTIYKIVGNHIITLATKDDKHYFLDPTQHRILIRGENKKELVDDKGKFLISPLYIPYKEYIGNYISYKKQLKENCDNISLEEASKTVKSVEDLCSKNLDIFENFYSENHELYQEINEKLLNMKKRKFLSFK